MSHSLNIAVHNLNIAAQNNDYSALYRELKNEPSVLDKIENLPFSDTPLHIAAKNGKIEFAVEIIILKPSLARKLDDNGYSPMHLALNSGHEKLARRLFAMDHELARVKGVGGKTPFHLAIEHDMINLLEDMLEYCSDCFKDLTVRGETAFHLAVKHKKLKAFLMLEKRFTRLNQGEILLVKDDEGYPVLHHAVLLKQVQMLKKLLKVYYHFGWKVGVNQINGKDQTALDIIIDIKKQRDHITADKLIFDYIEKTLRHAGAMTVQDLEHGRSSLLASPLRLIKFFSMFVLVRNIRSEHRDPLLVVAGLIITATFQIGVNPPGGLWQESADPNPNPNPNLNLNPFEPKHTPGTPIMAATAPFKFCFLILLNTIGFLMSFYVINELTRGIPLGYLLQVALFFLYICYVFSIIWITANTGVMVPLIVIIAVGTTLLSAIIFLRSWFHRQVGNVIENEDEMNQEVHVLDKITKKPQDQTSHEEGTFPQRVWQKIKQKTERRASTQDRV